MWFSFGRGNRSRVDPVNLFVSFCVASKFSFEDTTWDPLVQRDGDLITIFYLLKIEVLSQSKWSCSIQDRCR